MASANVYAVRQTAAHLAIGGIKINVDVYVLKQTTVHLAISGIKINVDVYFVLSQ